MMRFSLACAAVALCTSPLSAATFHTDEASYLTSTGAQTQVTPVNNGIFSASPVTADGATFTPRTDLSAPNAGFGGGTLYPEPSTLIDAPVYWISGDESFDITFTDLVYGVSFLIHEPSTGVTTPNAPDQCNVTTCTDTTFSFELLTGGIGGTSLGTFTLNPTDDAAVFVGFSDAGGFDALRVVDTTATQDNEFFGEFQYAAAAPVPLPAGLPLLLAGGAALFMMGRRRG